MLGPFNEYEKRQIRSVSMANVMGHLKQIASTPLSGGIGLSGTGDAERGNRLPHVPKEERGAREKDLERPKTTPPPPTSIPVW